MIRNIKNYVCGNKDITLDLLQVKYVSIGNKYGLFKKDYFLMTIDYDNNSISTYGNKSDLAVIYGQISKDLIKLNNHGGS